MNSVKIHFSNLPAFWKVLIAIGSLTTIVFFILLLIIVSLMFITPFLYLFSKKILIWGGIADPSADAWTVIQVSIMYLSLVAYFLGRSFNES